MKNPNRIFALFFLFTILSGCFKQTTDDLPIEKGGDASTVVEMQGARDCKTSNCGTSSIKDLSKCDLSEYGMSCELVKFLEENFAWTISENGVDFCSYELLGKEDEYTYLKVLCEEFYLQDKKIVCPDSNSREECFIAKYEEKKVCKEKCETKNVDPYLVVGGGVSIPLKVTEDEKGGFLIWEPRDGSYYNTDLKEHFPEDIYAKIKEVDGSVLNNSNIERAEDFYSVKAIFEINGNLNKTCQNKSDCGDLAPEYALLSSCPHELNCLENQCVAGCYDFSDYYDLPALKKYTWDDAINLIKQGEVVEVFQSHALDVQLILKDGTEINVKEPQIDAVFDEIDKCGEVCEDVVMGTE